jgi:chromate reductase
VDRFRILAICGSLRIASKNRRALLLARDAAAPDCIVTLWDGLAQMPLFSPDADRPGQELRHPVREFEAAIDGADGILIACPEYAHSIPGAFKNALDWMVGSVIFPGKPIALLNIAPHAHRAQDQLREVLHTMSAEIVENACGTIAFPQSGLLESEDAFKHHLTLMMSAFRTWFGRHRALQT